MCWSHFSIKGRKIFFEVIRGSSYKGVFIRGYIPIRVNPIRGKTDLFYTTGVFVFDIFTKSTRSCSIRVHVRVRYSVMKSGVATDGFQTLLAHLLNIHPNRSPKSKLP